MNLETYGLLPENPIKLNSTKAALGYLNHLVTKHDGYHILYHRLMSFDFNVFDGIEKTTENTTDIYEICTNDETIITIFINIHFDECVWIPPVPFEFESEYILICDKEQTAESEAQNSIVKVDKKYASKFHENWTPDDLDKIDPDSQEYILYRSWGVNYKTTNFPYNLWEKYVKENTYCISDFNEVELKE
ncbi:MAG: hypothetical protein WCG93_02680 [Paludibacter sp.]